jgi:hypothetical protein
MIMPDSPRRSRPIIISNVLDDSERSSIWNAQEEHICFLRLNSGNENVTNPLLFVVNLPPIVLQVVVLLSSVLMNEAEEYASRMMLLLAPVSTSALSRCSSLLTMLGSLPTQCTVVGWDDFASLVLLDLNGLEEVNKYYLFSPLSLLVVKLISVERMDSAFLFPLFTACSLFRLQLQLPFKCVNFFEKNKEGQRLLSGSSFGFKASLFLLFKFDYCSAISRVVVVLVTIVTPHVGLLMILRRLAYTTGNNNSFLIIYW